MKAEARLRWSVAFLAAAVLVYEIGMTRLLSFLLHYHFTFLVVSGAVCGLGLGAALAFYARPRPEQLGRWVGWVALVCALSMALAVCGFAFFPRLPPYLLALIAGFPIVLAGLFLTWVFTVCHGESAQLYFFDLAGAAMGTLVVIPALEWLGGPGVLLLAASLALIAAAWVHWSRALAVASLVALAALVLQARDPWLRVDLTALGTATDKPMFRALKGGGEAVAARWSAYARTDVVDRSGDTGLNLYVDGGAGSYMFRFAGDFRSLFFLRREAAFFPYYFGPRERALVIGPGGGQDILYALMTGWQQVEGVEVNPEIVSLVREYGDYNGHLFDREGVDIHAGDGRHFLENSPQNYDLIALPLVYAEAADLVGYALLENYLFTREAFAAYLHHLTPGGRLALVVHNHALMLRAIVTLADLWQQRGLDAGGVLDHVVVVNGTRADPRAPQAQRPLILVQKEPYTRSQLRELRAVLDELGLHLYFAPMVAERPLFAPLRRGGVQAMVRAVEGDISPVSDARPFFYDVGSGIDPKLRSLFGGALLVCALVLLLPLAHGPARHVVSGGVAPFILAFYATGLGAAFMLVEMYLLQRMGLFLGYPTLSLAATLFGLLLAAGIGSLFSARFSLLQSARGLGFCTLGVGVFCLIYGVPLDSLLSTAHTWSAGARGLLVLALVFFPGLLMGALFPSAMRLASSPICVPWMWAANGFSSVLGSVGAVVLAMQWGVDQVLFVGGGTYALVGCVLIGVGRGRVVARSERLTLGVSWRQALFFVLLASGLWYGVYTFVAARYWHTPTTEKWPRLPVAEQVWPQALER
jgi:predicted membrane-bound spermidine synthase